MIFFLFFLLVIFYTSYLTLFFVDWITVQMTKKIMVVMMLMTITSWLVTQPIQWDVLFCVLMVWCWHMWCKNLSLEAQHTLVQSVEVQKNCTTFRSGWGSIFNSRPYRPKRYLYIIMLHDQGLNCTKSVHGFLIIIYIACHQFVLIGKYIIHLKLKKLP